MSDWFDFDGDGKSSAMEEYFAYKSFSETSGSHSSLSHYDRTKSRLVALPEKKPIESLTKEECMKGIKSVKQGKYLIFFLSVIITILPVWIIIAAFHSIPFDTASLVLALIIGGIVLFFLTAWWSTASDSFKKSDAEIFAMQERYITLESQEKATEKKKAENNTDKTV